MFGDPTLRTLERMVVSSESPLLKDIVSHEVRQWIIKKLDPENPDHWKLNDDSRRRNQWLQVCEKRDVD